MRRVDKGKNRSLQPSFASCAPLYLAAIEDAGKKMMNYIQHLWTAVEEYRRDEFIKNEFMKNPDWDVYE